MLAIVTPAKNEEKTLPTLARLVLSQKVKPSLWVIVDDGSSDRTLEIIRELNTKCQMVHGLSLRNETEHDALRYDEFFRYGFVVRKGFDYCMKVENQTGLQFRFLSVLDADVLIDRNYYADVLRVFSKVPRLGIASGMYFEKYGNTVNIIETNGGRPMICGGAMIFRRGCFEEIGGFSTLPRPDAVVLVKAINRGWHTCVIKSTKVIHTRPFKAKPHKWRAYMTVGSADYKLDYHPVNALSGCLHLCLKERSLLPLGYAVGFLKSKLRKEKKVKDEEVRKYFREGFYRRFVLPLVARLKKPGMRGS